MFSDEMDKISLLLTRDLDQAFENEFFLIKYSFSFNDEPQKKKWCTNVHPMQF